MSYKYYDNLRDQEAIDVVSAALVLGADSVSANRGSVLDSMSDVNTNAGNTFEWSVLVHFEDEEDQKYSDDSGAEKFEAAGTDGSFSSLPEPPARSHAHSGLYAGGSEGVGDSDDGVDMSEGSDAEDPDLQPDLDDEPLEEDTYRNYPYTFHRTFTENDEEEENG